MNTSPQDDDWEERLRAGLGSVREPDFAAWCERHSDAVLGTQSLISPGAGNSERKYLSRRIMMTLKLIAASLILIGGIVWLGSCGGNLSPAAFADQIPVVDNVETMTWTVTFYARVTSRDGKRTWVRKERRLHAYRHPGQWRETMLDENGEVAAIEITDNQAGRMLSINVKKKTADLKTPDTIPDGRGPFGWVGDLIRERKIGELWRVKSISQQGQKQIDHIMVNVVTAVRQDIDRGTMSRQDIFFDVDSKRLVGFWTTSVPDLTLEALENEQHETEKEWSMMEPIAMLTHEIDLHPQLTAADFSLDPPADYAFNKIAAATVTEEEMIEDLGVAANFNNKAFPDSPFLAYDSDKLNAAWKTDESARGAEVNALIALVNKIRFREIYQPPVQRFVTDQTSPDSFYYVGSGIKVGQADRIVCWYKLRASKTYRAVYGDLSVKDVTEADLPLSLSK